MMSRSLLCAVCVAFVALGTFAGDPGKVSPNGIEIPEGYRSWRMIAPSHRTDNNTLRVILGNPDAAAAVERGETRPWPDGTVLAKVVWRVDTLETWASAIVPGEYVQIEFMVKDEDRFPDTGGWGFARWIGPDKIPYGADASFALECFGCHAPVKENDYVFTMPAAMP